MKPKSFIIKHTSLKKFHTTSTNTDSYCNKKQN